jgi:RNA polymerase sigma-70 factor (ECF subfamily)
LAGESFFAELNDQQLLEMYRVHHKSEYLGILLKRYTLLLLGVCNKYLKNQEEAKDAVQQVFSKVIQEVEKYPIPHFKSWLYTITRNHCFMLLRKKHVVLPEEYIEHQPLAGQDTLHENLQHLVQKEAMLELLEEALSNLTPNQQECVSLFYLQKLSYQQISAKTGFELLQVKSYIQNGKRNMRIFIEKKLKENEK